MLWLTRRLYGLKFKATEKVVFTMREYFLACSPVQSTYSESVIFILTRLSVSRFNQGIIFPSFISHTSSSILVDYLPKNEKIQGKKDLYHVIRN